MHMYICFHPISAMKLTRQTLCTLHACIVVWCHGIAVWHIVVAFFLDWSKWKLLNWRSIWIGIVEHLHLLNFKMHLWNLPLAGFCLIIWNIISFQWPNQHVHTSRMKPIKWRVIFNNNYSLSVVKSCIIFMEPLENAILAEFWLVNHNFTAISGQKEIPMHPKWS